MSSKGGIGIWITNGRGKVVDSYLDFNVLLLTDPLNLIVTNNLFLAKGNIAIQMSNKDSISGLIISNNRWWSENNQ